MNRPVARLALVCVALTLLAAAPRFHRLGARSFSGDEDITALVANRINEGAGAVLPSGLEYRRALPYTWAVAASARWLDAEAEASYRVPSAVLGTLTVPLLFLFARYLTATPAALVAALLLALSGWHIGMSRDARMYAPFLFFFLAAAFSLHAWAHTGRTRYLLCSIPLWTLALTLHLSGVLLVLFALLPLVTLAEVRAHRGALLGAAAALVAAAMSWERYYVAPAYAGWTLPAQLLPEQTVAPTAPHSIAALIFLGAGAAVGMCAALWFVRRAPRPGALGALALYGSAVAAGALAGAGQLYGAAVSGATFLLLLPAPAARRELLLAASALLPVAAAGSWLALDGSDTGVRALLAFPKPYGLLLGRDQPVLWLLFATGVLLLALTRSFAGDRGTRMLALAALVGLGVLGAADRPMFARYAIAVYPLVLMVAAATLLALLHLPRLRTARWRAAHALAVAVGIVLLQGIGGHGLRAATQVARLEHREPIAGEYPYLPDHASAGRHVRARRGAGDVVIAEDPVVQAWYAGRVDYALWAFDDASPVLYLSADGRVRDQYVGSALVEDPAQLDAIVAEATHRVWFITAGHRSIWAGPHLTARQLAWRDSIERVHQPVFTAREGLTRVYCLNCPPRSDQLRQAGPTAQFAAPCPTDDRSPRPGVDC